MAKYDICKSLWHKNSCFNLCKPHKALLHQSLLVADENNSNSVRTQQSLNYYFQFWKRCALDYDSAWILHSTNLHHLGVVLFVQTHFVQCHFVQKPFVQQFLVHMIFVHTQFCPVWFMSKNISSTMFWATNI